MRILRRSVTQYRVARAIFRGALKQIGGGPQYLPSYTSFKSGSCYTWNSPADPYL